MNLVNRFYWVFPSDKPVQDEEFLEAVKASGKAVLMPRHEVVEIRGNNKVESVVIRNKVTGETSEVKVDAIFIEIGYVAKTDFVKDLVKLNEKGEIIIDIYGRTSREGIFAAGDMAVTPYKQAVIVAAQGVTAALTAYSYVMSRRGREVKVSSDWRKLNVPGAREGEVRGKIRITF